MIVPCCRLRQASPLLALSTSRPFATQRPASVCHEASIHSPPASSRPRQCSSAASYPLQGSLRSPVHRVVDRSACTDLAILDRVRGPATYTLVYDHADLLARALAACVGDATVSSDGRPVSVAVLCSNGYQYVAAQWACWSLGLVFVPLCSQHPAKMMEYFLTDSSAAALLYDEANKNAGQQLMETLKIPTCDVTATLSKRGAEAAPPMSWTSSVTDWTHHPATLFYTSGTTGPPKGVPVTHSNLSASIRSIADAWQMSRDDCVLHCLPLHHVHGVINALTVPLAVGASVNMLEKFDAEKVWMELLGIPIRSLRDAGAAVSRSAARPTVFMAVPTMYAKLIQFAHDCRLSASEKADVAERCKELRVMISGSAPLPDPILNAWEDLTGHRLLERYGMTEIGMGLTNPLRGERIAGAVGHPFPGVEARIVGGDGNVLVEGSSAGTSTTAGYGGEQGELQIRGPSVFHGYWQKPEATKKSFTEDQWFLTGDTAVYEKEVFRIVGRTSVDIIKFGGYKISALDVERCLLAHPAIADCAVIGLPDDTYGQVVTAIVVVKPVPADQENILTSPPSLEELGEFVKKSLPPYLAPRQLRVANELPRNTMGKVNKKELAKLVVDGRYD